MEFNTEEYDEFVEELLINGHSVTSWVIAMAEETGEVCGKLKRLRRGDYDIDEGLALVKDYPDQFVEDMGKELGDILYYLTACAHSLGFNLSDIMQGNVEKLMARKEANTIMGQGDSR